MRLLALLALLGSAGAAWGKPVKTKEAGGEHIRLETDRGAVHVWVPAGYRSETAGVALYVHGYYTDVDKAWRQHHLAEQFRQSRRNALFIAPEAPDGIAQQVFWPELGELFAEVRRQTGLQRPWGPVVAMVHSGGYRTAVAWLDDDLIDDLVLLDAMYGEEDSFRDWILAGARRGLLLVGADTIRWTEPFARELAMPSVDQIPARAERAAGRLYLRAQYRHMDLVTNRKVIPVLYQLTRLPAGEAAR